MSRPDHFPDCMALSSKREACLGYRETRTKLDLEEKENARLLAALGAVEEWWLSEGMKHFTGAPYAIFAVRAALGYQQGAASSSTQEK